MYVSQAIYAIQADIMLYIYYTSNSSCPIKRPRLYHLELTLYVCLRAAAYRPDVKKLTTVLEYILKNIYLCFLFLVFSFSLFTRLEARDWKKAIIT